MRIGFELSVLRYSSEVKVSDLEKNLADKDSQLSSLNKQLSAARTSQSELDTFRQAANDAKSAGKLLEAELQKLKDKNNVSPHQSAVHESTRGSTLN